MFDRQRRIPDNDDLASARACLLHESDSGLGLIATRRVPWKIWKAPTAKHFGDRGIDPVGAVALLSGVIIPTEEKIARDPESP